MLLQREKCNKLFFKLLDFAYEFWLQKIKLCFFRAVQSKASQTIYTFVNIKFTTNIVDQKRFKACLHKNGKLQI